MDKENKVIDLIQKRNDLYDKCEDWEDDYILISAGKFEELIKLREIVARKKPRDIHSQWRLGQAYVLNKEYQKAIEYFKLLYKKNPDNGDIEHSILDTLFGLGKTEMDFEWKTMPKVLRLDIEALNYCYQYLKGKRKARTIDDLYCDLIIKGYTTFNEEELLNYLSKDDRFEIDRGSYGYVHDALLKIARKNK